jgi:hypothetical protein
MSEYNKTEQFKDSIGVVVMGVIFYVLYCVAASADVAMFGING